MHARTNLALRYPLGDTVDRMYRRFANLITLDAEGGLPTEFRILRAGVNTTTKGPLVFDEAAAVAVMAAYELHGVDIAIDLQHDSINRDAMSKRSDAADARGWCKLELRNGDLWGVRATWTPDGTARLTNRTQRYISPIVLLDADTNAVSEIFNLALVSMPAMDNVPALVASRIRTPMSEELIKGALDALSAGDADAASEILKKILVELASGESSEATAETPDAAPEEMTAEPEDADDEGDEEKEKEAAAMANALRSTLRVETPREVLASVKRMQAEIDSLKLSRDADEQNERVSLVGELVKLGAELPATAWADADTFRPVDTLRDMPMAALRSRVEAFRASPTARANATPPKRAAVALSDGDQARAETITDAAARDRFIALRLSRETSR